MQSEAFRRDKGRADILHRGITPRGHALWTDEEVALLRRLHPHYDKLVKAFAGRRTRQALRAKAMELGIARRQLKWTAAQVSLLRRIYRTASVEELRAAFPNRTLPDIHKAAKYRNLHRRRQYVETGIPLIDEVRARCFELGLTMRDLDVMARTNGYFSDRRYKGSSGKAPFNGAMVRAVYALDGRLTATWNE